MAKNETKAAPEELEQNQETEENQETETKQNEMPINPFTGRPLNPAGNPVTAFTSNSWWQPKPEEQGQIFCKSGPYKAPGEPD